MLLKVSLIIAILASVGTLVLSHLQVATKVQNLKEELQTTVTERDSARQEAATAKNDFKKAKEQAEATAKQLAETQSNLEIAMSNWKTQQDRADKLESAHKQVTAELVETSRELSAWRALGIPLDQVRNRLAEADKIKLANEALNEEKKVMARKIEDLKRQLAPFIADKEAPPPALPPVKGKVLAVDPKWDFVVIDVGQKDGAVERGELLISRDGKLVAKVRIARVEQDRSIANILPEWKQAEVNEGDIVMN
ncbi:MAG TPA: hypothetical protein PLW35_06180 [Verrucomicrobiota bacterium]|nr:hypothetical protein [Verrucomicrobiota bacterium]HOK77294.1 hypothetical protein [Verrucomicrobiota bacterium]